ncbi:MAG: GatB/YqeY domain-containing protein [Verrucomicrobiota bacterium]
MSLQSRLQDALKAAMLARDAERTGALRLLKSAFGYVQIEKKTDELADPEALVVVQREAKKRRDAIEEYERGGRPELAAKERAELRVIEEFLPQPLSPAELEELVKAAIAEAGAVSKKDLGAVMKIATARAAGRADGRGLSAAAGRLLS